MNKNRIKTLIASSTLAALFLLPARAFSISAFSRIYNTECSTCHDPYPHRNEFGEAFRKNGYVWPGRTMDKAPEGEEAYWLSGILKQLPVSASIIQNVPYDSRLDDDKLSPSTDLQLHAGGIIRDQIGFFAHDLLGSAEAFAVFRHLLGPVNVKYGKIIPQTTLWKPNQTFAVAPLAPLSLTVAGEPALGAAREGVELNAILGSRLFAAAGCVDRQQQDAMEYFGHLSYKISGTDYLGNEPELDFDAESIWDFLTITLGGYAYFGTTEANAGGDDNRYHRLGLEAEARYKGLSILLSTLSGKDDNADGNGLEVDTGIFLLEIDYAFSAKYLTFARYEDQDVGNAANGIERKATAGLVVSPISNVTVRIEGARGWNEAGENSVDGSGTLRLQYHF